MRVIDKLTRKQYEVEPRAFEGRLLHQLPAVRTPYGDAYAELYLAQPAEPCQVALTRSGTRVVENLASLPGLDGAPWSSRYLQGLIDAPFLSLTPGTQKRRHPRRALRSFARSAQAARSERSTRSSRPSKRAEDEQASQQSLRAIQRAFREALLALPPEEYDWFDVQARARSERSGDGGSAGSGTGDPAAQDEIPDLGVAEPTSSQEGQRQFFDYAGPLFGVVVSPAASTVPVNERRRFRVLPRDRSRRRVTDELSFAWDIVEGEGSIDNTVDQEVEFTATAIPGLVRLRVTVTQREVECSAEALVTVTDSLDASVNSAVVNTRGLPGYTFERAAGELWRSRFDAERNVIVVNNGHRDFVFATKTRALQLRYLVRLYVKELVLKNFAGMSAEQLLERMVELSLYAEEKLKTAN